jgi:hypothetical protein
MFILCYLLGIIIYILKLFDKMSSRYKRKYNDLEKIVTHNDNLYHFSKRPFDPNIALGNRSMEPYIPCLKRKPHNIDIIDPSEIYNKLKLTEIETYYSIKQEDMSFIEGCYVSCKIKKLNLAKFGLNTGGFKILPEYVDSIF